MNLDDEDRDWLKWAAIICFFILLAARPEMAATIVVLGVVVYFVLASVLHVPNYDDLVFRLRERARIRRSIPTRKSVQEGARDRIADLLDEAANAIEGKTNE